MCELKHTGEGGGGASKKPAWFARAASGSWHWAAVRMPSFLTHFPVVAFDERPKPNAKRAASGAIVPIASGGSQPSKRGRRGQIKNALYSTALADWDWTKWDRWYYPRKDGDARELSASVESSAQKGHNTKLLVVHPPLSEAEKKHRAQVRRASKLLVETNRNVRGSDGGSGKMAGGGDHFAYSGLVEVRQGTIPHTT